MLNMYEIFNNSFTLKEDTVIELGFAPSEVTVRKTDGTGLVSWIKGTPQDDGITYDNGGVFEYKDGTVPSYTLTQENNGVVTTRDVDTANEVFYTHNGTNILEDKMPKIPSENNGRKARYGIGIKLNATALGIAAGSEVVITAKR